MFEDKAVQAEKKLQELNVLTGLSNPSEDGIALAFAEKYKDELRFDHTSGNWFQWDRNRWKQESTKLAFHWARELCREYLRRFPKHDAIPKVRTASAVEIFAQADRRFAVTFELWNTDPWLLCTPGGTVDLKTGELRKSRPADHITKSTAVAPATMPTPIWDKFLHEATNSDDELLGFLQKIAGYCLTGSIREHALFFIYGLGGNGKSVFVNTVAAVMGDYASAANMEMFTASKYDRHPTELARLHGARLVTASETEEGRAWAEARIKHLSGGEKVTGRYMRKDFFEYEAQFKLVFLGNHKPVLHNVGDAMRRRFNIVPFVYKPEIQDLELSEKLIAEYPGILQWALDGCMEWQRQGLSAPEIVRSATDDYFADQDIFTQWLDECTERKYETTGETSARLFESWARWTKQQGEDQGTSKTFSEKMNIAGYKYTKHTPGNRGKRGYKGIAIRGEDDDYSRYED